ncbi:hypothetical protein ACWFRF_14335 [Nocardia sp. NPDC055165]
MKTMRLTKYPAQFDERFIADKGLSGDEFMVHHCLLVRAIAKREGGFLSDSQVQLVFHALGKPRSQRKIRARLLNAGLWVEADGGLRCAPEFWRWNEITPKRATRRRTTKNAAENEIVLSRDAFHAQVKTRRGDEYLEIRLVPAYYKLWKNRATLTDEQQAALGELFHEAMVAAQDAVMDSWGHHDFDESQTDWPITATIYGHGNDRAEEFLSNIDAACEDRAELTATSRTSPAPSPIGHS